MAEDKGWVYRKSDGKPIFVRSCSMVETGQWCIAMYKWLKQNKENKPTEEDIQMMQEAEKYGVGFGGLLIANSKKR